MAALVAAFVTAALAAAPGADAVTPSRIRHPIPRRITAASLPAYPTPPLTTMPPGVVYETLVARAPCPLYPATPTSMPTSPGAPDVPIIVPNAATAAMPLRDSLRNEATSLATVESPEVRSDTVPITLTSEVDTAVIERSSWRVVLSTLDKDALCAVSWPP